MKKLRTLFFWIATLISGVTTAQTSFCESMSITRTSSGIMLTGKFAPQYQGQNFNFDYTITDAQNGSEIISTGTNLFQVDSIEKVSITMTVEPLITYKVMVTLSNQNGTQEIEEYFDSLFPYEITGIQSVTEAKKFSAKVARDGFVIENHYPHPQLFNIYNILGAQVAGGIIDAGETRTVDMADNPKGYYFVANDVAVIKLLLH